MVEFMMLINLKMITQEVLKFLKKTKVTIESLLCHSHWNANFNASAGTDASQNFESIGHSNDAKELLKKYRIGTFVEKKVVVNEKERETKVGNEKTVSTNWIPVATALAAITIIGFLVYSRQKKSN